MRRTLDLGTEVGCCVAFKVCFPFFLVTFFVWWASHQYTPAMQVFRMSIIGDVVRLNAMFLSGVLIEGLMRVSVHRVNSCMQYHQEA
jgi:hypothetical protein